MRNNSPLTSITLSAYNVEKYIADSLDCLINQTYTNIEIICIDDGSTDNTLKILSQYANNDNRILVISKEKNEGLAVARNQSLALAKGKYVTFLDGDDLFDLNMIEKAVSLAEKNNSDMVIWDYAVFYNEKELNKNKTTPSDLLTTNKSDKKKILKRPAFTGIKLIKTKVAKELNIHFPKGLTRQDIPVHWHLITSIDKISILPERLYYYRQQPQATTAGTDKRLFDLATVMDITYEYLIKDDIFNIYKDAFLESQLNLLAGMFDRIDSKLKNKALEIIKTRLKKEQNIYLNSNKPLRWQSRTLLKSINGSVFNKIKLNLWKITRNIYRRIK